MRHEIDETVLRWIDTQLGKQEKPTLTKLLRNLGVKNTEEKETLYAWAWRRANLSPEYIVTVWAEDVEVDQSGNWKLGISLDPSGSPHYNVDQVERERQRIEILQKLAATGSDCRAILMINRRSREEEKRGVSAEAECRVLDDERWHVEIGAGKRQGTLRRGPRILTSDSPEHGGECESSKKNAGEEEIGPDGRLRFPNQATRDRVEAAAIEYARKVYASQGRVQSVESENLGYDLEIKDERDNILLKVEVKGTAGADEVFFLTRNEHRESQQDQQRWRLAIVTHALDSPSLQEYRVSEMEKKFRKSALVWHCVPA